MKTIGSVCAVLTGRARTVRPGFVTGIDKQERLGPVAAGPEGLDGDEQGDRRVHGGPDKAVHLYPREHYEPWIIELGALPVLGAPGAFGENLSTAGLLENDVCLGDTVRVGGVVLQVSQSRQPCWRLNHRFGVADMARRVQERSRPGWYCRVLQPGELRAGDSIELLERPHPEWPLERLMRLLYRSDPTDPDLVLALQLPIVPSWRRLFERRIESGQIEDWRGRLFGA
ncbi:MAG: MOSC domain-containing protein [Burkholderiaceae bacterium]|nr:MOSC domain-containing protein [Burkholderiaceae bacterium]